MAEMSYEDFLASQGNQSQSSPGSKSAPREMSYDDFLKSAPDNVGGGRGGQGGPGVGERQAYEKQQRKEAVAPQRAAIIGAGQGYTAGLVKYPVAGVAMLADRVINPTATNPLSWEDAKKYYTEEIQQTAQNNPKSYMVGEIGGAVLSPLARAGSPAVGTSVASRVAGGTLSGATYGGVSGYTQNEDLGDAAQGAAFGGVAGAFGAAIPTALAAGKNALVKTEIVKNARVMIEKAENTIKDLFVRMPDRLKGLTDAQLEAGLSAPTRTGTALKAADAHSAVPKLSEGEKDLVSQYLQAVQQKTIGMDLLTKPLRSPLPGTSQIANETGVLADSPTFLQAMGRTVSSTVPGAIGGAVTGAGLGAADAVIHGTDILGGAETGALYGAGVGGFGSFKAQTLSNVKTAVAKSVAQRNAPGPIGGRAGAPAVPAQSPTIVTLPTTLREANQWLGDSFNSLFNKNDH